MVTSSAISPEPVVSAQRVPFQLDSGLFKTHDLLTPLRLPALGGQTPERMPAAEENYLVAPITRADMKIVNEYNDHRNSYKRRASSKQIKLELKILGDGQLAQKVSVK